MNPWVKFLKEHSGQGYSVTELRNMYEKHKETQPSMHPMSSMPQEGDKKEIIYNINPDADIKYDSLLESFKDEYDITGITQKLENTDELSQQEEEAWKLAFEMALTDDYVLTKEQLLNSHDWWLTRLDYHSGIDDDKFEKILKQLTTKNHKDIYEFLDDVLKSFSVEELYSINLPELSN